MAEGRVSDCQSLVDDGGAQDEAVCRRLLSGDAVDVLDTRLAYLVEHLASFVPLTAGVAILTLLYEHLYHGRSL